MFPRFLRSLSIKHKLTGIILLTSLTVLGVAAGALLIFEIVTARKDTARSLSTMADIVAENSAAALLFDDRKFSQEIMSGLRVEPDILLAALYDQSGKTVATYPAVLALREPAPPGPDGVIFKSGKLFVTKAIMQGDRRVGTVCIEGTFDEAYRKLGVYGLVLAGVVVASVFLAYLLSNAFQRLVTEPLLHLASTAKIVSAARDYSLRATKMSEDELGELTDAFNVMLDQIQGGHTALRDSEERFRTLADNMAQLAWMADELGSATWYNQRWYDYTGTTFDEMRDRGWEKVHHPDHVQRVRAHILTCFRAGTIWEDTFPLRGRDGQYRWFLSRAIPIRSADGAVVRWFGTNTDVTEQRLVEEQLRRARDEALGASRAKDDFLAALSHELRTPLNPVLLLASDAAVDDQIPEEIRGYFETIRKNVELEARLIDDLLDLTRITRGKLTLDRSLTPLHGALADALAIVQPEFAAKGIHVAVTLAPAEPSVFADGVRLQQVFWNILKNAAKFTPDGGRVTIATRVTSAPDEVLVEISDSGLGLTPDEINRVFEAFSQGDHAGPASAHRFGGLGLGLAISRSVVEFHGGRIIATSTGRHQGATFTVALPLAGDPADQSSRSLGPSDAGPPAAAAPGAIRVLLVEDHPPTRDTIEKLLKRRGYDTTALGSLAEARHAAAHRTYHLLICDLGLPDGFGDELMKELSAAAGTLGIALTGYGMEKDVGRTHDAGFLVHLTKPIQIDALEETIARVMAQLGVGAPDPAARE